MDGSVYDALYLPENGEIICIEGRRRGDTIMNVYRESTSI